MTDIDRAIKNIKNRNFCGMCTTALVKGLNSCTDCENYQARKLALEALQEKQEKDKIRCENCQTYNKKLCPISKCYNNDPKNGWKTPFEKKDFCSYFTGGLKNV